MFSIKKNKPIANIVIEDYCLRMVIRDHTNLDMNQPSIEETLPEGVISNGKIKDAETFSAIIQEIVAAWHLKGMHMRFYVPNALVIMRDLEIPANVIDAEIKQYIMMEIGNTIHFPFQNPIFDVYHTEALEETKKVTVFAAPEEDIMQYTALFSRARLKPVHVDIQALGCYRYFHSRQNIPQEQSPVYLLLELNLRSVNISIFHQHFIEFLRFQPLNVSANDWKHNETGKTGWQFSGDSAQLETEITDQLNELASIMNFYQFSVHKGMQTVTDIVLFGDMPNLTSIYQQLQDRFAMPVHRLEPDTFSNDKKLPAAFIPALGLALKGGNSHA